MEGERVEGGMEGESSVGGCVPLSGGHVPVAGRMRSLRADHTHTRTPTHTHSPTDNTPTNTHTHTDTRTTHTYTHTRNHTLMSLPPTSQSLFLKCSGGYLFG